MGWRGKLMLSTLGIITAIFAWSLGSPLWDRVGKSIVLISASILLLGTVAWRQLSDSVIDENDLAGWVAVILGLVVLVTGLLTAFGANITWEWFSTLARYAGVATGAFIILLGLFSSN